MIGKSYFTVFTWEKAIFYFAAILYVVGCCVAVAIQPFLSLECQKKDPVNREFQNSLYIDNPCKDDRIPALLYMSVEECIFGRRIIAAVAMGGLIGWERRQAERPAGIRTMALVSLGSCLFSITSAFAFLHGPMAWDASRVSAAIPSGVGFLGSALIFKQQDAGAHTVHGLTTAASVWLSAAVGIACSGGLYFVASFSCAIMLVLLRFGPRYDYEDDLSEEDSEEENDGNKIFQFGKNYSSTGHGNDASVSESARLLRQSLRSSARNRPHFVE
jgi:putative Mg2+ transporter-C (MgtC) family protein